MLLKVDDILEALAGLDALAVAGVVAGAVAGVLVGAGAVEALALGFLLDVPFLFVVLVVPFLSIPK
jgi:hypothetical protein